MLLDRHRSALLVVDMQARLVPAIHEAEAVTARVRLLLDAARQLGVPVLASEQYPKGLGPRSSRSRRSCPKGRPCPRPPSPAPATRG